MFRLRPLPLPQSRHPIHRAINQQALPLASGTHFLDILSCSFFHLPVIEFQHSAVHRFCASNTLIKMQSYQFVTQPYPNTHSVQQHNHHGGRSRRAPRLATQNTHRQFRGVRSMKELTEAPMVNALRTRFDSARSFDLDDDLEFCPGLLTEDDVCVPRSITLMISIIIKSHLHFHNC